MALQPQPAGTVKLTFDPAREVVVARLDAFGLTPASQHRVRLFARRDAGMLSDFPDVTADNNGRIVTSVTSGKVSVPRLPDSLYFEIYLQGSQSGKQQSQVIGFAHYPTDDAQANERTLQIVGTLAQPAHARLTLARVSENKEHLTVHIGLSGLAPNSAHAVHIHSGSCQAQGPVLYPLPDLMANAAGTATENTTLQVDPTKISRGVYLNIHDGNMNEILQNNKPTALFQPVACGNFGLGGS